MLDEEQSSCEGDRKGYFTEVAKNYCHERQEEHGRSAFSRHAWCDPFPSSLACLGLGMTQSVAGAGNKTLSHASEAVALANDCSWYAEWWSWIEQFSYYDSSRNTRVFPRPRFLQQALQKCADRVGLNQKHETEDGDFFCVHLICVHQGFQTMKTCFDHP